MNYLEDPLFCYVLFYSVLFTISSPPFLFCPVHEAGQTGKSFIECLKRPVGISGLRHLPLVLGQLSQGSTPGISPSEANAPDYHRQWWTRFATACFLPFILHFPKPCVRSSSNHVFFAFFVMCPVASTHVNPDIREYTLFVLFVTLI